MSTDSERTMRTHLEALVGLRKRLEPGHLAIPRIDARIEEAKQGLKDMQQKRGT